MTRRQPLEHERESFLDVVPVSGACGVDLIILTPLCMHDGDDMLKQIMFSI